MITERAGPSIRTAVGWLYPLEHYDRRLSLDPLTQYAELLLIMGSREPMDVDSMDAVLAEAQEALTEPEFVRLQGYVDLFIAARAGTVPSTPEVASAAGEMHEPPDPLPGLWSPSALGEPPREEPVRAEDPDRHEDHGDREGERVRDAR